MARRVPCWMRRRETGARFCGWIRKLEEVRALPVALSGSSQRHRGCARGSGPPAGGCGCVSAHTHPVRAAPPSLSRSVAHAPRCAPDPPRWLPACCLPSQQRHPTSGIPAAASQQRQRLRQWCARVRRPTEPSTPWFWRVHPHRARAPATCLSTRARGHLRAHCLALSHPGAARRQQHTLLTTP
ncbi:MAG: hypothetical protein WDW38_005816 [Sanguina aurantia]